MKLHSLLTSVRGEDEVSESRSGCFKSQLIAHINSSVSSQVCPRAGLDVCVYSCCSVTQTQAPSESLALTASLLPTAGVSAGASALCSR
jgi:hypothetical protein